MSSDHLQGWKAIAAHLGIKPDAARHMHREHGLPAGKAGKTVMSSRSAIDRWRESRIVAAQSQPGDEGRSDA